MRNLARGSLCDCPFRYQGQYEDEEVGLYYNRFRYYSPDIGTYVSQDPIGLAGEMPNIYAYVRDSNTYFDCLGLSNNPIDLLNHALSRQGFNPGDSIPSNFKEKWTDSVTGIKYEARIHPGNAAYTSDDIFRISRKRPGLNVNGQGLGTEYLDKHGTWHHESTLKEFNRDGTRNPRFNNQAARDTHMRKPSICT